MINHHKSGFDQILVAHNVSCVGCSMAYPTSQGDVRKQCARENRDEYRQRTRKKSFSKSKRCRSPIVILNEHMHTRTHTHPQSSTFMQTSCISAAFVLQSKWRFFVLFILLLTQKALLRYLRCEMQKVKKTESKWKFCFKYILSWKVLPRNFSSNSVFSRNLSMFSCCLRKNGKR